MLKKIIQHLETCRLKEVCQHAESKVNYDVTTVLCGIYKICCNSLIKVIDIVRIWRLQMKTLIFLAKGFETMEFSAFVDVMGWARNDYECDVTVVTCGFKKQVISTFNIPVIVDKTIDEINIDEYDAMAIPGGFEEFDFYEEAYNESFLNLIREFDSKGKIIATVCVGALPVGKSGILKNRKATTYHLRDAYRQKQLQEFDVNVVNEPIVVDKNIITSYCPETASYVAFKLLEMLTSKEQMKIVKDAMGF